MAGYTDLPFRRVCRRNGLYFGTTALIDAGALVHGNPDSESILRRGEEEEFLQVQLLGSIPGDLRKSTCILREGPGTSMYWTSTWGAPCRRCSNAMLGRH